MLWWHQKFNQNRQQSSSPGKLQQLLVETQKLIWNIPQKFVKSIQTNAKKADRSWRNDTNLPDWRETYCTIMLFMLLVKMIRKVKRLNKYSGPKLEVTKLLKLFSLFLQIFIHLCLHFVHNVDIYSASYIVYDYVLIMNLKNMLISKKLNSILNLSNALAEVKYKEL